MIGIEAKAAARKTSNSSYNPVDCLFWLAKEQDDPNPTAAYGNWTVSRIGAMHKCEWVVWEQDKGGVGASIHNNSPAFLWT